MKNALALYIDALAAYAEKHGKLPDGAASDSALKPIFGYLRWEIAAALENWMVRAMQTEISYGKTALDATGFGPIPESSAQLARKTVVPSSMRSAEWALVPAQIRNVSQFSSGIVSARVMGAIQERLVADQSWDFSQPKGREAFIRDMREVMKAEGVGTTVTGEGSLTNPQANSRLGLIYDQQTRSARGYANYRMALDPDMLDASPCWELYRMAEPKGGASARRPWSRIWTEAGGRLYGSRMIALKTDPIWTDISRFGTPWPPFDYGSHMGVRDVMRQEAEDLGVIATDAPAIPEERRFDGHVRASAEGVPESMREWLKESLGDRIEFDGDTARLTAARSSTREEADAWGSRAMGGAQLTQAQKQALTAYSELRNSVGPDDAKLVGSAIERVKTHEAAVVWRASEPGGLGGVAAGTILKQTSFLATYFSRSQAENGFSKEEKKPILFEIYVPKGVHAIYPGALMRAKNARDTELLLQSGSRLYVRGLERSRLPDGREMTLVKAEVLP